MRSAVLFALALLVAGCAKPQPLDPETVEYMGQWAQGVVNTRPFIDGYDCSEKGVAFIVNRSWLTMSDGEKEKAVAEVWDYFKPIVGTNRSAQMYFGDKDGNILAFATAEMYTVH
ncbi:hypothetical protein [Planctomycetes bacterium TBK1r]|uniref:Lipoprotein n=1 Tax=Stieleria magnilauensis TaxID=2527963 RepID=A0ABX5XY10_9BACT|nr:hypothetical protein TBK1r_59350 [Planctomycetes bacterium TBK1r]QDV86986.1 hypothetical protein TBK1r_60130 [Planctomycetes bacterium TBK1r]